MTVLTSNLTPGQSQRLTEARGQQSPADSSGPQPSAKAIRAGRILSGLAVLFLAFDAAVKVLKLPPALEGTTQLGYPVSVVVAIGLVEVAFLVAYLIPRTAILGAILWTGYLGGAVASHVRIGHPLFTHTLSPIYVAAFLWAGLWLRDRRLRALLP